MAHHPVQIVLNTKDYFEVPDPGRGGRAKDFFDGRDKEFADHKARLLKQVSSISAALHQSNLSSGFVKVELRKDALAKSHRPVQALFPPNMFPSVGTGRLGVLYYHVTASNLNQVSSKIATAEGQTRRRRNKQGKLEAAPSQQRSEVGAIQTIALPAASDKRAFSVDDALAWLRDERVGGGYLIELFDLPPAAGPTPESLENVQDLRASLIEGLNELNLGIEMFPFAPRRTDVHSALRNVFVLRILRATPGPLTRTSLKPIVEQQQPRTPQSSSFDMDRQHHQRLLHLLDDHPLVRRVTLPPIVAVSRVGLRTLGKKASLPKKDAQALYPRVGIIDGGVSNILDDWMIGRNELLAPTHRDASHGTFIGGLLISGRALNNETVAPEVDGCELYDIGILPDENVAGAFNQYFGRGIHDFLLELENSVIAAKDDHGVRIFNMSINLQTPVEEENYGPVAAYLDEIADRNDAMFVLSAGNLGESELRPVWPADHETALKQLATRPNPDTIFQPGESARSVTVGALNPPDSDPCVAGTPASYTRRGPGMKVGVKPDFAHFGGSVPSKTTAHHGLFSIDPGGITVSDAGTSYAAPLVAKTLAVLDASISGRVARETLMALSAHHAKTPKPLAHDALRDLNRQFIGFGMPVRASEMLVTNDSSITLVFADTLKPDRELRFNFVWPRCMTDASTGSCRGAARMTLAYRPPLDARFGAEFVRVNLDAHLRQERKDEHFKGRARQIFLPKGTIDATFESELIDHGLKWWPTKVYEGIFKRGVGTSSNWQIVVDSIRRSSGLFPAEGIPFTLVVTIYDPMLKESVFNDLRQELQSRRVQLSDIKIASRIRLQP